MENSLSPRQWHLNKLRAKVITLANEDNFTEIRQVTEQALRYREQNKLKFSASELLEIEVFFLLEDARACYQLAAASPLSVLSEHKVVCW